MALRISKGGIAAVARLVLLSLAIGGLIAASTQVAQAQNARAKKITFSLDFIPLGQHAAYYAALGAGYFREEGLDVSIVQSQGTAAVIQSLDAGVADVGLVDVSTLVLGRVGGSKVKVAALIYHKAPYTIFSLSPGAAVREPKQLEGLKLGSGAGSFTPKVIRGYMASLGLDPNKLQVADVAGPARAGMLLTRQVPAVEFFLPSKSRLEESMTPDQGKLETFLLADHGLQLYSTGIGATETFIAENPAALKGVVRAVLRGWKLAIDDPKKAAAYQQQYVPTLTEKGILGELVHATSLVLTDSVRKNGLGTYEPAGFDASAEFVTKYIGVQGTPPSGRDLYVDGFLPSPAIFP